MRAWLGVLGGSVLFVSLFQGEATAQPVHCEHALEATPWPATGEPSGAVDPTPVTMREARRAVAAFRAAWRSIHLAEPALRSLAECWSASYEHFVVRRVSSDDARRALESPGPAVVLGGSRDPGAGWVWEVYWGGASRRHPPSGAVSAYFSPDLATCVARLRFPEG